MNRCRTHLSGFTLIELMLVVALIGILSALAIPQYQDYITRARWSDNIQNVGRLKQAIGECMQNRGQVNPAPPCNRVGIGVGTAIDLIGTGFLGPNFTPTATYGTVAVTATGAVRIVGNLRAGNCTVTLTPTGGSNVTWTFTSTGVGCNRSRTGLGS